MSNSGRTTAGSGGGSNTDTIDHKMMTTDVNADGDGSGNDIEYMLRKGKRSTVEAIKREIMMANNNAGSGGGGGGHQSMMDSSATAAAKLLPQLCRVVFDVRKSVADWDTIDWIQWIVAGGLTPHEFAAEVKKYDNATKCGLVWTANFVAYRCRTCGISPCMSLCADCFKKGNHDGHDFNMFRSQAGGACDCGDDSVMKEQGFCQSHGSKDNYTIPEAPGDLLCVAKAVMPQVIYRLILHLRRNDIKAMEESDVYIKELLLKLTEMGAAMRYVLSDALTDANYYSSLSSSASSSSSTINTTTTGTGLLRLSSSCNTDTETDDLMAQLLNNYRSAKRSMPHFRIPIDSDEYKIVSDIAAFDCDLVHKTFLEELLFWTIVYEFPQKLVCFLLNMLPNETYKEAFAQTFVSHYSRVSLMLCQSRLANDRTGNQRTKDNIHDILSNCVVHVSVQLFSNEELATKLCQKSQLLYVIVISLKYPIEGCGSGGGGGGGDDGSGSANDGSGASDMAGILMSSPMHDPKRNAHNVVRCDHQILKEHWYWPIVSDLNNLLTHRPVAQLFMNDCALFDLWLELIMAFQGMNLNQRELNEHVEYENNAYYSAFSAELEICSTPMWTLICHLKDSESADQSIQIIKHVLHWLETWFELIAFDKDDIPNPMQSTFHLPLHRYFSVFTQHAVTYQNCSLVDILPDEQQLKQLLAHPLQTFVSFYEILCGLWVRNGLQIKGQAMTYIQCHFCNSMVDSDLFLIQQVATHVDSDWFVQTLFERFYVWDSLSLAITDTGHHKGFLDSEYELPMLESALTHLATLLSVHNNLGMTEEQVTRKEMVALLAMADKTHSQLLELLPEKCGNQSTQNSYFEPILSKIAEFKSPNVEMGGSLVQGQFYPKADIWLNEYDPIHVLLRAVHRRDYQSSMDRFAQFARQSGRLKASSHQPWPPFRIPPPVNNNKFVDPRKLLHSKILHGVIFSILYKAVFYHEMPDQILALTIYLLDMAIRYPSPVSTSSSSTGSCGGNSTSSSSNSSDSHNNTTSSSSGNSPKEVNDLQFGQWFPSSGIMTSLTTPVNCVKLPERRPSFDGAVEEMDIDGDSSDSQDDDEDEYMSDEDEQPYEVHSPATSETGEPRSIESSIQRPQLPTITVPLALLPAPNPTQQALVPVNPDARQVTAAVNHHSHHHHHHHSLFGYHSAARPPPPLPPALSSSHHSADNTVAVTTTAADDLSIVSSSGGPARLRSRSHRLRPVRSLDQRIVLMNRRRQRLYESAVAPSKQFELTNTGSTAGSSSGSSSCSANNSQQDNNNPNLVVTELIKALPSSSTGNLLTINETIVSLLVRLHSKLSGRPDSYKPSSKTNEQHQRGGGVLVDSCIGDGPYFIERFLNHFIQLNVNGDDIINEIRQRIWSKDGAAGGGGRGGGGIDDRFADGQGNTGSGGGEENDREERRRKARERQQKLMAEFASKQKAFMKNIEKENINCDIGGDNNNNSDNKGVPSGSSSTSSATSSSLLQSKEYECVICGQSGATTNSKLFGQVVLLQSTSVLGHSTTTIGSGDVCSASGGNSFAAAVAATRLPNTDDEVVALQNRQTLAKFMEKRIDEMDRLFDKNSWLNSFNIGWEGGVHVQSCGHYLHIDCHKSYMQSLRGLQQSVHNRYGIEQGEYACPLCRQQANSVLPINPAMGEIGAVVKCRPNDLGAVAQEIWSLLANGCSHPESEFLKLLGSAVEDLTKATGPQYRNIRVSPSHQSLFLFLCSISRTNLESDILTKQSHSIACGAKKSCFVPLFHVLALNAKVVITTPYDSLWCQLTGLTIDDNQLSVTTIEKEVPLLVRDVSALLIQLFYALPLNVDKAYFTTVVQSLMNLRLIQAVAQLSTLMSDCQRIQLSDYFVANNTSQQTTTSMDEFSTGGTGEGLANLLGFVIHMLDTNGFYANLVVGSGGGGSGVDQQMSTNFTNKILSEQEIEDNLICLCLPFLRLASMLSHHLYSEPYPKPLTTTTTTTTTDNIAEEFQLLSQFLQLAATSSTSSSSSSGQTMRWATSQPRQLVHTWCQQFTTFAQQSLIGAQKLLRDPPVQWRRPALLRLPALYDQLFMFYHQRQCRVCNKVPKDPSICLICGTLICMHEACCRPSESCLEAVFHSNVCGAGTAIYLACNSSTIIVIRGKRACVWGSVYLDQFGEEDKDLKRGKPLYLSEQRYWILEQQWLTHSFDHTNKRWVFHKDML
ncbi:E3 ubiquitin-protein ligase ubr3-like isoform X2 [Oppia nitens]|uniref:E3 ubiquitin-protein ligase ubr3-like isoform X2 n=1 Tax=Oppia nitens TaxID=1686743 RepID=UPI0023DADE96|nr:E3 ubiquitin-protein ligase ubr3-like isoform X2 [Oppia nitens]